MATPIDAMTLTTNTKCISNLTFLHYRRTPLYDNALGAPRSQDSIAAAARNTRIHLARSVVARTVRK